MSCGIFQHQAVLDLDYAEDSQAMADANFVFTEKGSIVEIQATAEDRAFPHDHFEQLMQLAQKGISELVSLQKHAIATVQR